MTDAEKERQERIDAKIREQAALVRELTQIGFLVESLFALALTPKQQYADALPVLLRRAKEDYSKETRDDLYRVISACRGAKGKVRDATVQELYRQFKREPDGELRLDRGAGWR